MKNKIIKHSVLIIIIISAVPQLRAASTINESFLKKINTAGDETSCTMTKDRKTFIFARKAADKDNSDLYITEFKKGKWTEAAALTELNSDSDELTPFISPEGKFILFSSNRPGSLKNSSAAKPSFDIYFSEKTAAGWTKPELLFGAVNTRDDEFYPSITGNGKLLYISRSRYNDSSRTTIVKVHYSNDAWEDVSTAEISRNTGFDIYMYSKSLYRSGSYISGFKKGTSTSRDIYYSDDTDGKITELTGPSGPVNTAADEISVMESDRDSVIVSSDTEGNYDFYLKKVSSETKKASSLKKKSAEKNSFPKTFSVKVESENYNDPDGIKLNVLYFSSMKDGSWPVKTEIMSPDSSGLIRITVNSDIKRILILPGSQGMNLFSVEFLTKNSGITTSTVRVMQAEEREFSAKPVYFNYNSTDIQVADIPYLHELIEHLRANTSLQLTLEGYADGAGTYKSNNDISLKRAEKVKEYIVKAGIKKERIHTRGLGYINDSIPDTSQNRRRVESIIITQ